MAVENWTDSVALSGTLSTPQTISAAGAAIEGTIDLRSSKVGAYLMLELGRKGATALASAISLNTYRRTNNGVAPVVNSLWASFSSQIAASNATTCATSDSNSGQKTLTVASGTGYAAGDTICIYDASFTRLEFSRVSKVSGAVLTLDRNLQYTHTSAQADNVTRVSDLFAPVWLEAGSVYAVIVDYGGSATGSDVVVRATLQTFDSFS